MPNLADIRKQYPDYADMSDRALTDALHRTYYGDMPLRKFEDAVGYKRMGIGQAFDTAIEATMRLHSPFGRTFTRQGMDRQRTADAEKASGQVIARAKSNRGAEYFNPALGEWIETGDFHGEQRDREYAAGKISLADYARGGVSDEEHERQIEAARAKNPTAMRAIPTAEQQRVAVDKSLRDLAAREDQGFRERPLTSMGGSVVGTLGDPFNLAATLYTGGAGLGKPLLARMLMQGAANASIEAIEQPLIAMDAKRVGGPQVTLGDAALNIGAAGAFGAGFEAGGAGLRKVGETVLDRLAARRAARATAQAVPDPVEPAPVEPAARNAPAVEDEPPFGPEPVRSPQKQPEAPVIDPMVAEAFDLLRNRQKVRVNAGPSLTEWLAKGDEFGRGLVDDGGELSAIGADRWHTGAKFRPRLVHENGRSLGDAAVRAQELGYLPERFSRDGAEDTRATAQDLLDALRKDISGNPVYSRHRLEAPEVARAQELHQLSSDLEEIIARAGLDPHKMDNAQLQRSIDEYFSRAETPTATPRERAANEDLIFAAKGSRTPEPETGTLPGIEPANPTRQAIDAELRRRLSQRGFGALPQGGLFDEVAKAQDDLFATGSARREDAPGPSNRQAPVGNTGAQAAPGAGAGEVRPVFLDQNHADLYRLGQAALEGRADPAAAVRLSQSMGRYMDLSAIRDTGVSKAERAALARGEIAPRRMIELAKAFTRQADAPENRGAPLSWYDPDRYEGAMTDAAMRRAAQTDPSAAPEAPSAPPSFFAMAEPPKGRTAPMGSLPDPAEPPVARIRGNEIVGDVTEPGLARTQGLAWFTQNLRGQSVPSAALGGREVGFSMVGFKKIASARSAVDKVRLLPAIREVVANGRLLSSETPRDPNSRAVAFHNIGANIEVGGRVQPVRVVVRQTDAGDFHYDHMLLKGEAAPTSSLNPARTAADGTAIQGRGITGSDPAVDITPLDPNLKAPGDPDILASTRGGLRHAPVPTGETASDAIGVASYGGENAAQIAERLNRALGLTSRQGRMTMRKALGQYDTRSGVIRTKAAREINVLSHEGGHALDMRGLPTLTAVQKHHAAQLKTLAYPGADSSALREEGFAEWFRWYTTNPEHARKVAPVFYEDFERALEKDAPDMLADLRSVQGAYQGYLNAPATGLVASNIVTHKPNTTAKQYVDLVRERGVGAAARAMIDDIYTGAIDRYHPISASMRELRRIAAENGRQIGDIKTAKDPYRLTRLAAGSHTVALADLKQGVRPYHGVDPEGPSMEGALRDAFGNGRWDAKAQTDFAAYLASRRLVNEWDRFSRGELEREPDALPKQVHEKNIQADEAAHPQWREAAQQIHDYTRQLWKKALDAGLISNETFEASLNTHPFYVPLNRDVSDKAGVPMGRGGGGRNGKFAGGSRQFRGSNRPVIDPVQSIMRQTFEVNAAIMRNDALKALDGLAKAAGPGGGAIAERIPAHELKPHTVDAIEAARAAAREQGLDKAEADLLISTMRETLGDDASATTFKNVPISEKGEPIMYLWEGGKRVPIRLPDGKFGKQMMHALAGMDPLQKNAWLDMAAGAAAIQRAGIVTHPDFMIRNFIRDQISAWILTDVGFKPFISSAKGMVAQLPGSKAPLEYMSFGGIMGGINTAALGSAREMKTSALKNRGRQGLLRGTAHFTEVGETATRLGVYQGAVKRAEKSGLSPYEARVEAAYDAKDYFDPSLAGSWPTAEITRRIIPFFNASIQGMRRGLGVATADGNFHRLLAPLGKAAPKTPGEKRAFASAYKMWAQLSAVGVVGAGLELMNMGDPEFAEFDDRERATHWFVKSDKGWWRIPKPFELAFASNLAERVMERQINDDPTALKRLRVGLGEIFLPPSSAPILSVPYDLARNKDNMGRPIIPEGVDGKVDPQDEMSGYTSEAGKFVSRAIGALPGVNAPSPAAADYAMAGFGGSWGREAIRASNALNGKEQAAAGREDMLGLRAVTIAPERSTDSAKTFWGLMSQDGGELARRSGSFNARVRVGDFPAALKYLHDLKPAEREYVIAKAFSEDGSSKAHPLERARDANSVISNLRRDLNDGRPVRMPNGQPVLLTPEQRRGVDKALGRLQMAEQSNALRDVGVAGWTQREPFDVPAIANEVGAASPEVLSILNMRMSFEKVPSPAAAANQWTQMRQVIDNLSDQQLEYLMAQKRLRGSSSKLDEGLRRRELSAVDQ